MRTPLFLIAITCLGAACGEIDVPVDPLRHVVAVPAGQAAAATIGPAGGFVELGSVDGARFRLDVPAGALESTTTIRISTGEALREQRFLLRFAPAGLSFGAPATITVELPSTNAVALTGALTYDGVPVVVERLPNGAMRVPIRRFASALVSAADLKGTEPEMPHSEEGPPACVGWRDDATFVRGALVATDELSYGLYGECAAANIGTIWTTGAYSDAVRLTDATDAFLQRPMQVQSAAWRDGLQSQSCFLLEHIVSREPQPQADRYGLLHYRLGRVLFLARHLQLVGGTCAANSTYPTAVDAAIGSVASFYATRNGAITSTASSEYASALQDAREGAELARELRIVGASDEVVGHATRVVQDVAHPALIALMLPAAQAACAQNGNIAPLAQLISLMGPRAELTSALASCSAATLRRP